MTICDASAVAPLLAAQRHTRALQSILAKDSSMVVWWSTPVECVSALARLERERSPGSPLSESFGRLRQFAASWQENDPSDEVRETAVRLLRVHPLRAGDALQLAAAFVAASGRPSSLEFVVLDERLAIAAQKEGFSIVEIAV
ncbi:MAG TPA: type II toxin-antitoxin system VapC family toxin [Pseudolabrys sp.]|nr:type II toxin-antitoxin system VapC family toxin [Pseudolabrys sp.]